MSVSASALSGTPLLSRSVRLFPREQAAAQFVDGDAADGAQRGFMKRQSGWLWSGCFSVDEPGELYMQVG